MDTLRTSLPLEEFTELFDPALEAYNYASHEAGMPRVEDREALVAKERLAYEELVRLVTQSILSAQREDGRQQIIGYVSIAFIRDYKPYPLPINTRLLFWEDVAATMPTLPRSKGEKLLEEHYDLYLKICGFGRALSHITG